jgi:NADH-quinone oxidoreductase subunit E
MICGAEDLIAVCKERIAPKAHQISDDGKFSWEEVECLGACSNAPMAQIGKDYYEDLTVDRFRSMIDEMAEGQVPVPGPQNGRYASEPLSGLTSLVDHDSGKTQYNASVQLAVDIGDTLKRIDGTEVPLTAPWQRGDESLAGSDGAAPAPVRDDNLGPAGPDGAQGGRTRSEEPAPRNVGDSSDKRSEAPGEAADVEAVAKPETGSVARPTKSAAGKAAVAAPTPDSAAAAGSRPQVLDAPKDGAGDDLKSIKGIGPKLAEQLNSMGIYHFEQIANWGPEEVSWVDQNLEGFKGRATRDKWVDQAKVLVSDQKTEISSRAEKDDI